MIRGVLLDWYGTVVEEDDEVVAGISRRIAEEVGRPPEEIAESWGRTFSTTTASAASAGFRLQRRIVVDALQQVLDAVGAGLDAAVLCEAQFAHWRTAALRSGSTAFLRACPVPICVVSNIDDDDLSAVIAHHGLDVPVRVTSEEVRSYKPRPEIFTAALARLGLRAGEVLHVGDSLTSDVAGANALGIPVAWVNRRARARPRAVRVDHELSDLRELLPVLASR